MARESVGGRRARVVGGASDGAAGGAGSGRGWRGSVKEPLDGRVVAGLCRTGGDDGESSPGVFSHVVRPPPAPLSPRYATVNPKNSFSLYQTASDTLGRRQGETTLQPNSLIIETHAPGRERAAHRQQLRTQRGGSVEWLTFEERGEGSGKR